MSLFRRVRRRPFLTAGLVAGAALIGWLALGFADESADGSRAEAGPPPRVVTVVTASPQPYEAEVSGLAEVHPRWVSTVRAEVGGRLLTVSDAVQPGSRVRAGEVLAVVDTLPWAANLAEARNRLATAELHLLRAQQEAEEARRSWEESGLPGDPSSALVLHGPQIAAAEAEIAAARSAEAWAAQQLERTRLRAPFDGVVIEQSVSVGEVLIEGGAVVTLFGTDVFQLALPLSDEQWANLPRPIVGARAFLHEPGGGVRASATVVRDGGAVDPGTRMRTLYLEVADPLAIEEPLLPGTFVEVRIPGRTIPGLLRLPEGVLTRRGLIWYVDSENALRSHESAPRFTSPGQVYVPEPEPGSDEWRIVRYPLESFLAGQVVEPTAAEPGG